MFRSPKITHLGEKRKRDKLSHRRVLIQSNACTGFGLGFTVFQKFIMVDYSKWDKIANAMSDSDEDEGGYYSESDKSDDENETPQVQRRGNATHHHDDVRARMASYGLYIHPEDNLSRFTSTFLQDPSLFIPTAGEDGAYYGWGLSEESSMENMISMMSTQFLYGNFGKSTGDTRYAYTPEEQMARILMKKKLNGLPVRDTVRDLTIKLTLSDKKEVLVWRTFKVSSEISLHLLHDKIIGPVMGWVRNYHAYAFNDVKDGSMFGPNSSTAIDMMHKRNHGHVFIDAETIKLGQLCWEKGDALGYVYDFGDQFTHHMTVTAFSEDENADGKVVVLSGANACPPEDSNGLDGMGNAPYGKLVRAWSSMKSGAKSKARSAIMGSLNYQGEQTLYEPTRFDLQKCQERVRKALASKNSAKSGTKKFNMTLNRGNDDAMSSFLGRSAQKGERVQRTHNDDNHGMFMSETISTKKDGRDVSLCNQCGNPQGLKRCSQCHVALYCSGACQKQHWKEGHNKECKTMGKKAGN